MEGYKVSLRGVPRVSLSFRQYSIIKAERVSGQAFRAKSWGERCL